MKNILNKITSLFGNKYEKDIKALQPIIEEINQEYETLLSMSNDQLRNQTDILRKEIQSSITDKKNEITNLDSENLNVYRKYNASQDWFLIDSDLSELTPIDINPKNIQLIMFHVFVLLAVPIVSPLELFSLYV